MALLASKKFLTLVGAAASIGFSVFSTPLPAKAAPTTITYTGTITDVPAGNLGLDYTVGDKISIALTFNENYDTSCGSATTGQIYNWNTDACGKSMYSNIVITGTKQVGTFNQLDGTSNDVLSYDSLYVQNLSLPIYYSNPSFTSAGYGQDPLNSIVTTNGNSGFTGFNIAYDNTIPGAVPYQFTNSYLQPWITVGSSLPSPTEFFQYFYSSSRYRDYSITGNPPAQIVFSEGAITFTLDSMDIVTTIPAPLPLFGAGTAFYTSRRIRNRIKRNTTSLA